jgi:hypothetical protein
MAENNDVEYEIYTDDYKPKNISNELNDTQILNVINEMLTQADEYVKTNNIGNDKKKMYDIFRNNILPSYLDPVNGKDNMIADMLYTIACLPEKDTLILSNMLSKYGDVKVELNEKTLNILGTVSNQLLEGKSLEDVVRPIGKYLIENGENNNSNVRQIKGRGGMKRNTRMNKKKMQSRRKTQKRKQMSRQIGGGKNETYTTFVDSIGSFNNIKNCAICKQPLLDSTIITNNNVINNMYIKYKDRLNTTTDGLGSVYSTQNEDARFIEHNDIINNNNLSFVENNDNHTCHTVCMFLYLYFPHHTIQQYNVNGNNSLRYVNINVNNGNKKIKCPINNCNHEYNYELINHVSTYAFMSVTKWCKISKNILNIAPKGELIGNNLYEIATIMLHLANKDVIGSIAVIIAIYECIAFFAGFSSTLPKIITLITSPSAYATGMIYTKKSTDDLVYNVIYAAIFVVTIILIIAIGYIIYSYKKTQSFNPKTMEMNERFVKLTAYALYYKTEFNSYNNDDPYISKNAYTLLSTKIIPNKLKGFWPYSIIPLKRRLSSLNVYTDINTPTEANELYIPQFNEINQNMIITEEYLKKNKQIDNTSQINNNIVALQTQLTDCEHDLNVSVGQLVERNQTIENLNNNIATLQTRLNDISNNIDNNINEILNYIAHITYGNNYNYNMQIIFVMMYNQFVDIYTNILTKDSETIKKADVTKKHLNKLRDIFENNVFSTNKTNDEYNNIISFIDSVTNNDT